VSQVLRVDRARLGLTTPLKTLGMDSLMGLELRNRLESALGLTLPATVVWTYPTIRDLAAQLAKKLELDGAPLPALPAAATGAPTALEEQIALIGMGCRFPGAEEGPADFWRLLAEGGDAVQEISTLRWSGHGPMRGGARWAATLRSVETFDAAFFEMSPREAIKADPQQRLALEVAWEALEHAGQVPERLMGSRTGVYVGMTGQDYELRVSKLRPEQHDIYSVTGLNRAVAAGRISYALGLQGPAMTLDTACSSSLTAVHLACQSLRLRESDLALAGGANVIDSPMVMDMVTRMEALAPDGRCKTFDARANGFVRGEGCGFVVLKRLSDAQRDGDRVLAVILGSAVNQDGRSTGLTAPNVLSQQALLRDALQAARVEAREVDCVEAHGTGTSLGDPIELEALKEVLGAPRPDGRRCAVGSVKTNVGHLEATAGIAGLIKVVLSLQHEEIPRHLHFQTLNPRVSFEGTPFFVPTKIVPWRRGPSRRVAGVSAFGLSGTIAHVVVQ
jgi:acyl transferase domain-containing protein/acyl carrier protein